MKYTSTGPCLVEVGSRCHGGEGTWQSIADECLGYNQVGHEWREEGGEGGKGGGREGGREEKTGQWECDAGWSRCWGDIAVVRCGRVVVRMVVAVFRVFCCGFGKIGRGNGGGMDLWGGRGGGGAFEATMYVTAGVISFLMFVEATLHRAPFGVFRPDDPRVVRHHCDSTFVRRFIGRAVPVLTRKTDSAAQYILQMGKQARRKVDSLV